MCLLPTKQSLFVFSGQQSHSRFYWAIIYLPKHFTICWDREAISNVAQRTGFRQGLGIWPHWPLMPYWCRWMVMTRKVTPSLLEGSYWHLFTRLPAFSYSFLLCSNFQHNNQKPLCNLARWTIPGEHKASKRWKPLLPMGVATLVQSLIPTHMCKAIKNSGDAGDNNIS